MTARTLLTTILFFTVVPAIASAQGRSLLESFAINHSSPILIESNAEALKARLALIARAQSGDQIQIATFLFKYGKAVRALTVELCRASQRGARVELLVDAKSGAQAGTENAYNGKSEIRKNEELYQFLANCGVKVLIHNAGADYVTLFNRRIPNIFGADVQTGQSVSPVAVLLRLEQLKNRLVKRVDAALRREGIDVGTSAVLTTFKDLIVAVFGFSPVAGLRAEKEEAPGGRDPVEDGIELIARNYQALIKASFWQEMDSQKMKKVTKAVLDAVTSDRELSMVRIKLRAYNRLNHRKIFHVKTKQGFSCAIIGGRNLGDEYLLESSKSFIDGDVLSCSNHVERSYLDGVGASFDNLKSDRSDFALRTNNVVNLVITPNQQFDFEEIDTKSLTSASQAPSLKAVRGTPLKNMRMPRLLESSWNTNEDQVRVAMIDAISREQKDIYIETAYAEFNSELRNALEKALARGVKVHVVTNGMFISDGASKLIRVWMAYWNAEMMVRYPDRFRIDFATFASGHMIHFKGAAFRCQRSSGGFKRTYLAGSHNFHPRSGYSDKENMLQWDESTDARCSTPPDDLVAIRARYYKQAEMKFGEPVLSRYMTLSSELKEVVQQQADKKASDFARATLRALYQMNSESGELRITNSEEFDHMIQVIDDGQFRDLIGLFF